MNTHLTWRTRGGLFVAAMMITSCGDDVQGAAGTGGNGSGTGGAGGTASMAGSLGCADGTLDQATMFVELEHDGTTRSYELHVPPSYDGTTPFPLVLNFHGLTSNAGQQRLFSDMDRTADDNDFVVAYPNGLDSSWNAGACCGQSAVDGVDDVGFARAVIDDLGKRGCFDLERVYATGMSNGGFMSHRLGCEASDVIAAIAPVAGVLGLAVEDCDPQRPVPVIHFHGTEDNLVPYDGGGLASSISAPETADVWADMNGCLAEEPTTTFEEGMVTCQTVDQCSADASVVLCTIVGGGHCWPGQELCPDISGLDLGISTTDIDANQAMWDFFQGHALP